MEENRTFTETINQDRDTLSVLNGIFNAGSVALVGASADPRKFGYMTLQSLLEGGYEGKIYPVNTKGGTIGDRHVYTSLTELPEPPDLVVVVVPAPFVAGVLREAAQIGAGGGLVLSAGFREADRWDLENELAEIPGKYGLRFIGPNVQGINYLPNKMCAMFFPVIKTRGGLGIVSQSGTVTAALSEWAADEGLGISAAINLGNQVDLCESDFLEFLAHDQHTDAVAMYIEGLKDGHRFLETLKRVTREKPVVILKGGRTAAGQKSAASHTGSLAGNHGVFASACRQAGAVMVTDLETLFDAAKTVATLKPPRGNRVLMVSTSGGAGTLGVDESVFQDLSFPQLPAEFQDRLPGLDLPPLARPANPFDLATVFPEAFGKVLRLADRHDVADMFLLSFGDPVAGGSDLAIELDQALDTPLAVVYFGGGDEEKAGRIALQQKGIPVFPSPERAMKGLGAAVRDARFRNGPSFSDAGVGGQEGDHRPARNRDNGLITVLEPDAAGYLSRYDIPYPGHGLAESPEEAVRIAESLGYPVVLKIVSPQASHKSDVGGVTVGLTDAGAVREGYENLLLRVGDAVPGISIKGVLVCRQAEPGLEAIVGAVSDPVFGPTIMFGLGGVFTEVIQDVSLRVAPLERKDALEMIREIKGYPLLKGIRGQAPLDLERVADLLLSVSRLMMDRPDIKELDLNPVRLYEKGVLALDVRILERIEPGRPGS